jgi:hypothetical protein
MIVEAGVAKGGSALALAAAMREGRCLHLYDTFSGIPPPSKRDGRDAHTRYSVIVSHKAGKDYYGYMADLRAYIKAQFSNANLTPPAFHTGLFRDTLWPEGPVAFAHVDGDWFESVMVCLQRLVPRLAPGGALVLDDVLSYSGASFALAAYFSLPNLTQHHDTRHAAMKKLVHVGGDARPWQRLTARQSQGAIGGHPAATAVDGDGASSAVPRDLTLGFDQASRKYFILRETDDGPLCRRALARGSLAHGSLPATGSLQFGAIAAISRCKGRAHANLGDYVQTIAALQWLPTAARGDALLFDRDNGSLAVTPSAARIIVWFNAWWAIAWPRGPPHARIVPILTGVHVSASFKAQLHNDVRVLAWFRKHAPVGVRDFGTLRLFQSLGVPAWFSGCPTALLQRPPDVPPPVEDGRSGPTLLIDVPNSSLVSVPSAVRRRAVMLAQNYDGCADERTMLRLTRRRLRELATAGLVVTTRLHVASPALAMGVRVVFVPGELAGGGGGRLEGMDRFFWTNTDADQLQSWYDLPRRPKDERGWREMRTRLLAETRRVLLSELGRDSIPGQMTRCKLSPSAV